MPSNVLMPQTGADASEGKIVRWLKQEGDQVNTNDIVAEIETEKVNMEVTANGSGTLGEMLPDDDRDMGAAEARVMLAPAVRRLSERDRRILHLLRPRQSLPPPLKQSRPPPGPRLPNRQRLSRPFWPRLALPAPPRQATAALCSRPVSESKPRRWPVASPKNTISILPEYLAGDPAVG